MYLINIGSENLDINAKQISKKISVETHIFRETSRFSSYLILLIWWVLFIYIKSFCLSDL